MVSHGHGQDDRVLRFTASLVFPFPRKLDAIEPFRAGPKLTLGRPGPL